MISLDTAWKFQKSENEDSNVQYFFIHIPKTGGTTFRFVLYNHFDDVDVYPTQVDLKSNGGGYVNQSVLIEKENYLNKTMLIGHYRVQVLKEIENDKIKTLAFFRNPIDRILSKIKHIRTYTEEYLNQDANLILKENWKQVMYAQSMAMGYTLQSDNMKNVRKEILKLDFIGITEYFEESLQLCNATFGWKLKNIPRKNVIDQEIFSQLSAKSKMKIFTHLNPELTTYNIAVNQFMRRCKKHGIQLST